MDDTFPRIARKHGPCTYSVEKLSVNKYMAELAGKKSFEHMLRGIFKTTKLKSFNSRLDVRIPAAILLDIMDGSPLASEEMDFISEVLANVTFIQAFGKALGDLQSDSRIGDFNIVKHPHINTNTFFRFFQKKLDCNNYPMDM